jgi:transcriptional regulator with XRE-family HTH domain
MRRHQLAEARKQLALGQQQIAAAMGVTVARISQIEHGEVTSFEVIARYVEALGGRLDLCADFGDRTIRLPVSDTPPPHERGHVTAPARPGELIAKAQAPGAARRSSRSRRASAGPHHIRARIRRSAQHRRVPG